MHTFGIKKHPKILSMADKEASIWDSVAGKAKSVLKDSANTVMNSSLGEAGRKLTFSKEDNALIDKVEKELVIAKGTPIYTILKSTGMISEDKASLAMRWLNSRGDTNDGREGAIKLLKALEDFKKGTLTILTYTEEKGYQNEQLSKYESIVKNDVSKMNVGLMKGFYGLRGTTMGFEEPTWEKIGLYIYSRKGNSRLLGEIPEATGPLMGLGEKATNNKIKKLADITDPIIQKLQLNNPKIALLFANTELKLKDDEKTIDVSAIIAKWSGEKEGTLTLKGIEDKYVKLAETLKTNGEALIREGKEELKKIPGNPKTLRDIGITNIPYTTGDGKTINISDSLIANADSQMAGTMLIAIAKYQKTLDKNSKDFSEKNTVLESIKTSLVKIQKGKTNIGRSGELNATANDMKRHGEKGGTIKDYTGPKPEVLQAANTIATARSQQESTRSDLKDYGINTLEQAEKKLAELGKKGVLSEKDAYLQKLLEQFIRDNITIAREQQNAEKILGKTQAQELFIETNRFVSGNPAEKYDFKALERIAVLTDPESTVGQKNLSRLEPGQTLSMDKFMEGDIGDSSLAYSPEVASIEIQMNEDGTYNIPLLKETRLTENQVKEYRTNIGLYASIGLSQFIPHIPTITEELRRKGINTSMDGSTGTIEQQKVLKEIYTLLFGKKLETTNLGDVERAFGSSLGHPENMKNAIQHTLKVHKLIGESGQPIATDTLKNWIRASNESKPINIDSLTNI